MKMRAAEVTAAAMSAVSAAFSVISTFDAPASFSKNTAHDSNSAFSAVSMCIVTFFDGGTLSSVLFARTAFTASIIFVKSASSAAKSSFSSYLLHSATMMLSASPATGMDCQISSVMNGMNGCRSFRMSRIT